MDFKYCPKCSKALQATTPACCVCGFVNYQNPLPVAVAVVPVVKDGDIAGLVGVLRSETTQLGANQWALPGGFMERGESVIEGALRELKEETNLSPLLGLKVIDNDISSNKDVLLLFVVTSPISYEDFLLASPSDEVLKVDLITLETPLAFLSHTRVAQTYLRNFQNIPQRENHVQRNAKIN